MTTPHHRRTNTDRRPPSSRTRHGNDGVRPPEQVCAGKAADPGLGDDVEDQVLPETDPVEAWRPRSATPQELDDARTVLVVHRLDPRVGRCAACAADCPCPPALEAGRVLAEAGAWNTVPFPGPGGWQVGPGGWQVGRGRTTAAGRWVARVVRLVRRLLWVAAK